MSDWNWAEAQEKMKSIQPRPVLLNALEKFDSFKGFAVDLGCGGGVDTIHLINSGWKVYAIDGTANGFANIKANIPADKLCDVLCVQADFESLTIPDTDLVYSAYSIPFCKREAFDTFWLKIETAIRVGGRFAGHFFGEQDGWINYINDITLKTKQETISLFKNFNIEYFDELCEDRPSINTNGTKRWHVFEVIAVKR